MAKCVVLLSGGLDSSTAGYIAKSDGFELYALTFKYGQKHSKEIDCAIEIGKSLNVAKHHIINFNLQDIAISALTSNIEIPTGRTEDEMSESIPVTYVPARNTIFLSFALALAESIESQDIYIGVNQVDYSGYPDCRAEYISAFENMANLATKAGVEGKSKYKIHTPLINMTKSEIIKLGISLGVDYSKTWSCYKGGEYACGECDSCKLRLNAFKSAGLEDNIKYRR
ncbi:MAG: 7-cyano-7-deazaguanine synthase QueC [Armatimonadota bacterium]